MISRRSISKLFALGLGLLVVWGGAYVGMRAYREYQAKLVFEDLRRLDSARDQWSNENGKGASCLPSWTIIQDYLERDSRVWRSGGRDVFGNKFIIGTGRELTSVDPKTIRALGRVVPAQAFSTDDLGAPRILPPEVIVAAREGDVPRLRALLASGTDIDQPDLEGRTPLYWAANQGHLEAARLICARHLNPLAAITGKSERGRGTTPWFEAILGHPAIVALFLDYGARPEPSDLPYAATRVEVLKVLLARGLSPNATDGIGEPILLSAAFGDVDCVRMLIEAGADVHVKRKDGETAIQVAVRGGSAEIVKLLQAAGAKE